MLLLLVFIVVFASYLIVVEVSTVGICVPLSVAPELSGLVLLWLDRLWVLSHYDRFRFRFGLLDDHRGGFLRRG